MWASLRSQESVQLRSATWPLPGMVIVEDHVEGGDAVRRHDQQLVVADRVHVAHLAAPQQRQALMLDWCKAEVTGMAYGKNEDPASGRAPGREQDETGNREARQARERGSSKAHRLTAMGAPCRAAPGRMLSKNAPRRPTRRCISPAAASAAPYVTRSRTSRFSARPGHCRDCQYSSGGAPAHALLALLRRIRDAAARRGQEASLYRGGSGRTVMRSFCPDCGTPLFGGTEGMSYEVVRAGSLDDPEAFRARVSLWTDSAPSWHHIDRNAPSFPGGFRWGNPPFFMPSRGPPGRRFPPGLTAPIAASLPAAYWACVCSGKRLDLCWRCRLRCELGIHAGRTAGVSAKKRRSGAVMAQADVGVDVDLAHAVLDGFLDFLDGHAAPWLVPMAMASASSWVLRTSRRLVRSAAAWSNGPACRRPPWPSSLSPCMVSSEPRQPSSPSTVTPSLWAMSRPSGHVERCSRSRRGLCRLPSDEPSIIRPGEAQVDGALADGGATGRGPGGMTTGMWGDWRKGPCNPMSMLPDEGHPSPVPSGTARARHVQPGSHNAAFGLGPAVGSMKSGGGEHEKAAAMPAAAAAARKYPARRCRSAPGCGRRAPSGRCACRWRRPPIPRPRRPARRRPGRWPRRRSGPAVIRLRQRAEIRPVPPRTQAAVGQDVEVGDAVAEGLVDDQGLAVRRDEGSVGKPQPVGHDAGRPIGIDPDQRGRGEGVPANQVKAEIADVAAPLPHRPPYR
ncbi:hypothetical protein FQR65_LT20045 [Abscondita terminalis]|nr:hypothetical protein FQR65_LT20045 [Abscondita terminalis]